MIAIARQLGLMLGLALVLGCHPSAADLLEDPEVRAEVELTIMRGREIHRRDKMTQWATQQAAVALTPENFDSLAGCLVDMGQPRYGRAVFR